MPIEPPPRIPVRWTDPAPVIAIVTLGWIVAAVATTLVPTWSAASPVCWSGAALGVLGYVLFLRQRRAARQGRRTAQRGLDVDRR